MASQSPLENLHGGKQEQDKKTVIAEAGAIGVVIILFICWAIYFFHKIENGGVKVNLNSGAQDQFNFTNVRDAQQQLQQNYGNVNQDLQDLRNQQQDSGGAVQQAVVQQDVSGQGGTQFAPTQ